MSDTPADERAETRTARFLFVFALLVVAAAVVGFLLWGLPALAMLGLAATVLVYGMLAAYAAGF
ncbi:hypothetical protein SAMN04488021_1258 [Paracoccus aminovorans]|uniref:Uncharacterized protein n=1 Tax=Paracoccus aminovorans TaxID=34004 RepID=A0A1I3BW28_9RHOB|nr:hypothetical protein [Paracoccus aminovorans]CQR86296.1 hypothetical protein JCM7685_1731 [Paracoccus aminovorans]SFH66139.1 hypothetical protein SAMN04488021_1258 [Paracoccus aminovorans]